MVGGKTAPPTTTNAGTRLDRIASNTREKNCILADCDGVAIATLIAAANAAPTASSAARSAIRVHSGPPAKPKR